MFRSFVQRVVSLVKRVFSKQVMLYAGVVFGTFLGLVILLDQVIMPWYTRHGEVLAVPNVIAKHYDEAKALLELQGLKVVKKGEKYDSQLPFGYVVDQNPRPNRLVKKGRRVYLTTSAGEREIQVPNLIGLSETNAEETLKSVGLRVGERSYQYVPGELPQVVIGQSVPPEEFVRANSAIDIVVSLGEPVENVVVPSVLGKTLEVARRDIQRAGLTVGRIRYIVNDALLPNTVVEQSLEAGLTVANGDTLNLVVSRLSQ